MTAEGRPKRRALAGRPRILGAALGFGLLAMLAGAAGFRPDPHGRGTHQQLGLPPCTFLVLSGRPCPSCGMTTAWAHFVRGHPIAALQANVGGTLLAVLALVVGPWSLLSAAAGRWLGVDPDGDWIALVALMLTLVTLIDWVVRLVAR